MKPFLQPCIIIILFEASIAWADEETDILDTFGSQAMISQATGYSMPLDKVPAIATIVTDEDIKNIGARNLAQALDPVPGLQVVTGRGTNRLLSIRGIFADLGPDVLIKRNNVPISQGFFTTLNPFDLLPVNNIERIEIIRGPNSATDGADALAGVINIVTKPSTDYRGTEIGGPRGDPRYLRHLAHTRVASWADRLWTGFVVLEHQGDRSHLGDRSSITIGCIDRCQHLARAGTCGQ